MSDGAKSSAASRNREFLAGISYLGGSEVDQLSRGGKKRRYPIRLQLLLGVTVLRLPRVELFVPAFPDTLLAAADPPRPCPGDQASSVCATNVYDGGVVNYCRQYSVCRRQLCRFPYRDCRVYRGLRCYELCADVVPVAANVCCPANWPVPVRRSRLSLVCGVLR